MIDSIALQDLSAEQFKPCEGQPFRITLEDGEVDLMLLSVNTLKGDTERKDGSPFSLLFHAPVDFFLEQQIVPLHNDTIGELSLFLVPLGPDPKNKERSLYEAIFT